MQVRRWMGLVLLALSCAPPARANGKEERIDLEFELRITRLVRLSEYQGEAIVTHPDPRYVVEGRVIWTERDDILAKGSKQAFAIHSPTKLGMQGAKPGDSICLLATRIRADGKTRWTLTPTVPDAGCRGGG